MAKMRFFFGTYWPNTINSMYLVCLLSSVWDILGVQRVRFGLKIIKLGIATRDVGSNA